jgi:hypothetical protein
MRSWLSRRHLGVPTPLLVMLAVVPLLFTSISLLDDDLMVGLLLLLVLVPTWLIGACIAIAMSGGAGTTSLQSIAYAVAVFALLFVFLSPTVLTITPEAWFIKFAAFKPWYDNQIVTLPSGEPHLVLFVWDTTRDGTSGVAYDDSDQIVKPPPMRSPEWRERAASTGLTCTFDATPIRDHYYWYDTWCN